MQDGEEEQTESYEWLYKRLQSKPRQTSSTSNMHAASRALENARRTSSQLIADLRGSTQAVSHGASSGLKKTDFVGREASSTQVEKASNPLHELAIPEAGLGFVELVPSSPAMDVFDETTGQQVQLVPWSKSRRNTGGDLSGGHTEDTSRDFSQFIHQPDYLFARHLASARNNSASGIQDNSTPDEMHHTLEVDSDPEIARQKLDGSINRFRDLNAPPGAKYANLPPSAKPGEARAKEVEAQREAHMKAEREMRASHKRTHSAYGDLLYELVGTRLLDRDDVGKHPLVIAIRNNSVAHSAGVRVGDELRSIDPMRDNVHGHDCDGFDVLRVTFEGICKLIAGQQPLTSEGIASVQLFEDSQIQICFLNPVSKREIQVPFDPEEMQIKLRKMRAASEHLGVSENKIEKNLFALFREMDTDGSGLISDEELREGLARIHCDLSDELVKKMFLELDIDRSGSIDWNEFRDAMISICGDAYMNQYPSWSLAREKVRGWMLASDPRAALDRLWPAIVVLSIIHLLCTAIQITLGFPLEFYDEVTDSSKTWGISNDARSYRFLLMMILGICVTLFAMSAVRLGSVQWLFVSGASQMISTSVASISGMASARNAISPEQAKWQRLCSALVILTGSATAAVTLLIGLRLSIYCRLQDLIGDCLRERLLKDCAERSQRSKEGISKSQILTPVSQLHPMMSRKAK